jgi:hypothetical protein
MTANHLALYNSARAALSKAVKADEVKKIRDEAMALKAAAKIVNDKGLEADALELRMRAERRLGELIEQQRKSVGLNTGTRGSKVKGARVSEKPTLAEAGIDKNLAHRARSAAAMSEKDFEEHVKEHREMVQCPRTYYPETKEQEAEQRAERKRDKANEKRRQKRSAELDARDDDDDAIEIVAPDAHSKSADDLEQFKYACRHWLPKLTREHLIEAVRYVSTFADADEVVA